MQYVWWFLVLLSLIIYSSPSVMEYDDNKYILCGDSGNFNGYATWYAVDESGNLHLNFYTDNSMQYTAPFDTDGCSYLVLLVHQAD